MKYEYLTESLTIKVKNLGRKGSIVASDTDDPSADIGRRINELAAEGWEFLQIGSVPMIGQTIKTGAYREAAVAVFRKPLASHP